MSDQTAKDKKMERIEQYRERIRELLGEDFPVDGGFATAVIRHKGVEYTVGQRAANAYDALAALNVGLALMQYELEVEVGPTSTSTTVPAGSGQKPVAPAGPAVSGSPAPQAGGNGRAGEMKTDRMPVETIVLASGGENPRWVVKGGKYKRYGVTCWPEVLDAWSVTGLDPMTENRIEGGWMAIFSLKDDGRPDKVIKFVPASG